MTDNMKKTCSRCGVLKLIEDFDECKALCKTCNEYKQQYRESHREELRFKAKEDYEENKERILIKVECPICKIQIIRKAMARHERTKRHQDNMNKTKVTNQEQEQEPKNIEK